MKKQISSVALGVIALFRRLLCLLLILCDKRGALDVAMISNIRDEVDMRRIGYRSQEDMPDVLPWTRFVWEGRYKGRLFVIGSTTENIGGDTATEESVQRACEQFKKAVAMAVAEGARTILYAAATKRLPVKEELKKMYPEVVFTLGDNFTGLLLGERIMDAFQRSGLHAKHSRVLVIAPYGLLGGVALHYVISAGAEVVCLGNPKRKNLLEQIHAKHGCAVYTDFADVGHVDMVVACNGAAYCRLTPERVELLLRPGHKLVVIDPNEPANMPPRCYRPVADRVIRLDSGNGYSSSLRYILGSLMSRILRLASGITWGCFCEAFIIAAHPELRNHDWLDISPANIALVEKNLGSKPGQFALPAPTCFNRPVTNFSVSEKTQGIAGNLIAAPELGDETDN